MAPKTRFHGKSLSHMESFERTHEDSSTNFIENSLIPRQPRSGRLQNGQVGGLTQQTNAVFIDRRGTSCQPSTILNSQTETTIDPLQHGSNEDIINDIGKTRQKGRGPTLMPQIWGRQPDNKIIVPFNELGQPNEKKSRSTLANFLGSIARNGSICPMNYADWRLMPNSFKDDMLLIVKSKFDISSGEDAFILSSINKKWRSWKNAVKSLNFDPNLTIEEQLENISDRVNKAQYNQLFKLWSSEKAKLISEKNVKNQAELNMLHRSGQTSFALKKENMKKMLGHYLTRVELFEECYSKADKTSSNDAVNEAIEKMKDIAAQNSNISYENDHANPNDAFAQVRGKDKNGHVRMYGLGVRSTDIYGRIPSRAASYRQAIEYKEKYIHGQEQYNILSKRLEELTAVVMEGRGQPNIPREVQSVQTNGLRVGSCILLKGVGNIDDIVGKGILNSLNSTTKVGGQELGIGWCEVRVQIALKKDEIVFRPYGVISTIDSAIGAPIAWPLSLVASDEVWE